MPVDFEVRVLRIIQLCEVVTRAQELLCSVVPGCAAQVMSDRSVTLGGIDVRTVVRLADCAEVVVIGARVPDTASPHEPAADEDPGGYWVAASVDPVRTGASYLLAFLLAIAIAELAEAAVVDDSGVISSRRSVSASEAFAALSRIVGSGDLATVALRMAAHVGIEHSGCESTW